MGARSPKAKGGRKPGQKSPAIARSARANGTKGGRPPVQLPADLLKRLGPPPVDVLEQDAWWGKLIAILEWGDLEGEPWAAKLERACKAAVVSQRLRDSEVRSRLVEMQSRADDEIAADASPAMVDRGKDPIAASQHGALRRAPS